MKLRIPSLFWSQVLVFGVSTVQVCRHSEGVRASQEQMLFEFGEVAGQWPCFIRSGESKTLAQIIGGLFVIGSLFSTAKTLQVSQQQAAATAKQADTTADRLQVAREGQITDRFTKAIEQLGNEKLEVRLGGIYSLERIAKESLEDHWPIVEVLTTFVREHAPLHQARQIAGKQSVAQMHLNVFGDN